LGWFVLCALTLRPDRTLRAVRGGVTSSCSLSSSCVRVMSEARLVHSPCCRIVCFYYHFPTVTLPPPPSVARPQLQAPRARFVSYPCSHPAVQATTSTHSVCTADSEKAVPSCDTAKTMLVCALLPCPPHRAPAPGPRRRGPRQRNPLTLPPLFLLCFAAANTSLRWTPSPVCPSPGTPAPGPWRRGPSARTGAETRQPQPSPSQPLKKAVSGCCTLAPGPGARRRHQGACISPAEHGGTTGAGDLVCGRLCRRPAPGPPAPRPQRRDPGAGGRISPAKHSGRAGAGDGVCGRWRGWGWG